MASSQAISSRATMASCDIRTPLTEQRLLTLSSSPEFDAAIVQAAAADVLAIPNAEASCSMITDVGVDGCNTIIYADTPLCSGSSPPMQTQQAASTIMKHSISMLEMNEIHDMVHLGDALDRLDVDTVVAYECQPSKDSGQNGELTAGVDDDDFLFMDDKERSDDNGGLNNEQKESSASPNSVADDGMGIMSTLRRGGSDGTLNLRLVSFVHTMSEEPEECNPAKEKCEVDDTKEGFVFVADEYTVNIDAPKAERRETASNSNNTHSSTPRRSSIKNSSSSSNLQLDKKKTAPSMKRNVSFSNLEIRSYNVTLGDAACSSGAPITLDWDYDPSTTQHLPIDQYESYRHFEAPRRSKAEMLMPASHRQYLLMREAGFSRGDIQKAIEEARRVAKNRVQTRKNLKYMPMEEALESTKRKFGRLTRLGSKK